MLLKITGVYMGLFNHVSVFLHKNLQKNIKLYDSALAYDTKANVLIEKNAPVSIPLTKDNELALHYPAQFIYKYLNSAVIDKAIKLNPNIKKILKENNLTLAYNLNNVNSIIMSHLIPTAKKAQMIYLNIGYSPTDIKYLYLTEAALLHDIGKIFIPSEILNKKGRLTFKERQIVELHNILSYEILKTTSLDKKVIELTLEHHNYSKKVKANDENQALTLADIYCALKEKRPYKNPINDLSARAILYDMATKGSFDIKYMPYLKI